MKAQIMRIVIAGLLILGLSSPAFAATGQQQGKSRYRAGYMNNGRQQGNSKYRAGYMNKDYTGNNSKTMNNQPNNK